MISASSSIRNSYCTFSQNLFLEVSLKVSNLAQKYFFSSLSSLAINCGERQFILIQQSRDVMI